MVKKGTSRLVKQEGKDSEVTSKDGLHITGGLNFLIRDLEISEGKGFRKNSDGLSLGLLIVYDQVSVVSFHRNNKK